MQAIRTGSGQTNCDCRSCRKQREARLSEVFAKYLRARINGGLDVETLEVLDCRW